MSQIDHIRRHNALANLPEWELTLDRIASGATIIQEAERLGVTSNSLYLFFKKDQDRFERYQEALETRAEMVHETQYDYAMQMVKESAKFDKGEITSIDRGMAHLEKIKRADHKRFRPEANHTNTLTPDNLKEFLAALDTDRKAQALERKTIEADYTAEDAPETGQDDA